MAYDGIVSRHLNRRISRPLGRAAARTPVTPNQLTGVTLLLAALAAGLTALGWNIAGGIGIQVVSIVDGLDGEVARLKNMSSRFGAAFDSISDRYADCLVLAGMTVFAVRFEDFTRPEVIGCLALAGTLGVSYSRARIEASLGVDPADSIFGLASRDVRLLVAAIGTVIGQCYWTLVVIAVICGLTIAWRLLYLRFRNIGTEPVK